MSAIIAERLTKRYDRITAIHALEFSIQRGELFGFIGPDGAGKTTLFRILTTLVVPDEGRATVNGLDVVGDFKALRRSIGYMPGRFSLYQDLSVEENLRFFAAIFGTTVEANYDTIREIYAQIESFKTRRAGALSGGMKQKLALSCALIHRPEVLFLDEPTTGVDAVSRKEFWETLKRLQEGGITIVVSTPYMDEAGLCDRVALMQGGRILDIDTPRGIVERFSRRLLAVRARDMYRLIVTLRRYPTVSSVHPFGEFLHYTDRRSDFTREEMEQYLAGEGFQDVELHLTEPQIEDCFMELMEEHAVDA